jgi:hypothetical protein
VIGSSSPDVKAKPGLLAPHRQLQVPAVRANDLIDIEIRHEGSTEAAEVAARRVSGTIPTQGEGGKGASSPSTA